MKLIKHPTQLLNKFYAYFLALAKTMVERVHEYNKPVLRKILRTRSTTDTDVTPAAADPMLSISDTTDVSI